MNPSFRSGAGIFSFPSAAFLGLAGGTLLSTLLAADLAVVKGNRANLRAAPSMEAEVVGAVPKGETIVVLENIPAKKPQPDDPISWAKIRLPSSVKVWVFAQYVDVKSGAVTSQLKVRSGPGKNFSTVGELKKGDTVEPIRTTEGWIQIEPPDEAVAYIANNLLEVTGPAPSGRAIKSELKRPATPESPKIARALPAREQTSSQDLSAPSAAEPVRAPIRRQAALPPEPTLTDTAATASAATTPPNPPPTSNPILTPTPTPTLLAPMASAAPAAPPLEISTSLQYRQPELVYDETRPRRVLREGLIGFAMSPDAPTQFQLNSFRHREGALDYLLAEDPKQFEFSKWRGKRVFIEGDEYRDRRWQTPVLKVRSIRTSF